MPTATTRQAPPPAMDAAWLRLVFESAAEEYAAVFSGKSGKMPPNYRPSQEDYQIMRIWEKLYNAVRDVEAGREVMAKIQWLEERVEALEKQAAILQSQLPLAPLAIAVDYKREVAA